MAIGFKIGDKALDDQPEPHNNFEERMEIFSDFYQPATPSDCELFLSTAEIVEIIWQLCPDIFPTPVKVTTWLRKKHFMYDMMNGNTLYWMVKRV